MIELVARLAGWVGAHPHAAGAVVALVAFSESLAFVGLVVPGATMMFAAGALIAAGDLGFWPIWAWAVAGAILGDGLSYWLGHRYGDRIRGVWPFRGHPDLLARGEAFFHRHGRKSIVLGRFVGPVRPVIPVVAGMLGMAPAPFATANVLSALIWAPVYLLPGMAFGASLALAGTVATRLALLVALVVLSAWLLVAAVRRLYAFIKARGGRWMAALARLAGEHRRLAVLLGGLIMTERPPALALALWFPLLIGASWLFLGVLEDVATLDPLVRADQAIYHLLQNLRGPSGDRLMAALSELGDAAVVAPVAVFVAGWLGVRRAWRDLGFWLAAVAFGAAAVTTLKIALGVPRPASLATGLGALSLPSGHATMSAVVYGFAAVLAAGELTPRWRLLPALGATGLVAGVAFSRLYLGAHWLSDVAGGLALAMAWIALLAIARQFHERRRLGRAFGPAVVAVLLAAGLRQVAVRQEADLLRYAPREPTRVLAAQQWRRGGWRELPASRIDLEGEYGQPLNLQWAGALGTIRGALLAAGWGEPVPLAPRTALRWLAPQPALADLPVLPQLHDGRYESLRLVRAIGGGGRRLLVLRLWSTATRLGSGGEPLWVGTVSWLRVRRVPLLLRFPATGEDFDGALAVARPTLPADCSEAAAAPGEPRARSGAGGRGLTLLCGGSPRAHD